MYSSFYFAANSTEERKVRVLGQQELHSGQAKKEQMPVLPISEVSGGGDGERRFVFLVTFLSVDLNFIIVNIDE